MQGSALFLNSCRRLITSARRRAGVTLTELMIAMAILTIGVAGTMGSFKYINMAMAQSRLKSIATNLAQEKMEVLKNKSYFQVLVTTAAAMSDGFDPEFPYDTFMYPPETITLWGMPALTRSVNIDYVSVAGNTISVIPYDSDDPGMKKITVYVSWTQNGTSRKVQLDSYYQNPTGATLSAGFRGRITAGGASAAGVLVQVEGSPKWRAYSDSGGNYNFQVAPGSYTLVCSSAGFFSQTSSSDLYVSQGNYTPKDFKIIYLGSGTISSDSIYAVNPGLVISQVVTSTPQAGGPDAQYIELFNPTTSAITIASTPGSMSAHSVNLNILSTCGGARTCQDVRLQYVNTSVAPRGYYLIANMPSFSVMGITYTADAYYHDSAGYAGIGCNPVPPATDWSPPALMRLLPVAHNGVVWLTDTAGTIIDTVGWLHNVSPTTCETSCVPLTGTGLLSGDQIVRFSAPCSAGSTFGRAYDSGDNATSFYYNNGSAPGINYRPFSAASPIQPVISGMPALSAYVFADDGNSAAARSSNSSAAGPQGQSCPYSSFTLVGVSTGVWKVTAVYGNYLQTISSVTVAQNATTMVPNNLTIPVWFVGGFNYTILASTYSGGLASGYVYGAGQDYWMRLSGKRVGSSDGNYTTTDTQGWYFLQVSTGSAIIHANYQSADGKYMTSDAATVILQGGVTSIPDFHLAKGGYLKGYVTSGTGAIPNIPVRATSGGTVYEDTSDNTGYFYIFAATSTVAYTITPELDPVQSYTSIPDPLVATLMSSGITLDVGTITVIGGLATINGSVTDGGAPITTGVLVVASTAAVTDPLPVINASLAQNKAILYSVSSKSDGTYSLEVISGTYSMRAFYPVVDVNTGLVSSTSKTLSPVNVAAGGTVTGKNFTWP